MIRILQGDCRAVLATLPDASVHCCVTSPTYWGLRAYLPDGHADKGNELGSEASPDAYVAEMVAVFREVRRVLRGDGTCWLNIGDSYNNFRVSMGPGQAVHGRDKLNGKPAPDSGGRGWNGAKEKDLLMIPARVALALQADGWYLRSDIIWAKHNCMPESVRDRPTTAHEHIFLLTKSPRYFYDAVAIEEDGDIPAGTRGAKGSVERAKQANGRPPEYAVYTGKRNKRSVWWMATQPFAEAHFATFPAELAETCIKAATSERGCCQKCAAPWVRQTERVDTGRKQKMADGWDTGSGSHGAIHREGREKGEAGMPVLTTITTGWLPSCSCNAGKPVPCTVLDPFSGAGTTALVADRLGRNAIGIELSEQYCDMARRRIEKDAGMFAEIG